MKDIKSINEILDQMEVQATNPDALIPTGFPYFDKRYYGFAPRETWIVGAYTGSGKTYFCLQSALNLIERGKRVVYFSLEMASPALVARVMANMTGIHATKLEYGMLDLEDHQKKLEAIEKLRKLTDQLFFIDSVYTVVGIKEALNWLVSANLIPNLVIVDFIQNLQSPREEYEKLSESVVQLQQLAKEIGSTFLLASQVSNEEAKAGSSSKIIGYKGSGAIAAAADFGLWLESQTDYDIVPNSTQRIDVIVRKARRGPNGKIPFEISFPSGHMKEAI